MPGQARGALPSPPLSGPREPPSGVRAEGPSSLGLGDPGISLQVKGLCLSFQAPPSGPEIPNGASWVAPQGAPSVPPLLSGTLSPSPLHAPAECW